MSQCFAPIGEHVEKISKWNPVQSESSTVFKYIDLSSVDKDKKVISLHEIPLIIPSEAPSRARQLVKSNDVIVSTVRPNLNGVGVVPDVLNNATASTGYCVLRTNASTLDYRYLYYWVRTNSFVEDMVKKATGASYPAVSDKIIKESKIPLPSLNEQKRIAAILDKADSLRRKRQQAILLADQFLRSVFLDLFGDPVTNPKGWEVKVLGDIVKFQGGFAFKSFDYQDQGIRLVKIANVHFGNISWDDVDYLPDNYNEKYSGFLLNENDLVMAMTRPIIKSLNSVKLVTISSEDTPSLLNQRVGRFIDYQENLTKEYLEYFIYTDYFKRMVEKFSSSALQPNISSKELESIEIMLPPKNIQNKFSILVNSIKNIKIKKNESVLDSECLFNSLSQKAFAGEL